MRGEALEVSAMRGNVHISHGSHFQLCCHLGEWQVLGWKRASRSVSQVGACGGCSLYYSCWSVSYAKNLLHSCNMMSSWEVVAAAVPGSPEC